MGAENRTRLESTSEAWQKIGTHLLLFEAPDLFISRTRGDVSKEDLDEMFTLVQRRIDATGPVFWISDVSRLGVLRKSSRLVRNPRESARRTSDIRALALVGANFHQRVVLTLGLTAGRLLRRDRASHEVGFFATEEEARAWIEALRARAG